MATTTAKNTEVPTKTLPKTPSQPSDPNPTAALEASSPTNPNPSTSPSKAEPKAAATTAATTTAVNNASSDVSFDVQKKIKRAERFGMPVQLSEEEKRNSRAERYGDLLCCGLGLGFQCLPRFVQIWILYVFLSSSLTKTVGIPYWDLFIGNTVNIAFYPNFFL